MATWNSAKLFFRLPLLLLGLAGAALSAIWLPQLWSASLAKDVTERLLADDRFKPGALNDTLLRMQAGSDPIVAGSDVARAEALIRLRIAEEAMDRNVPEEVDRAVAVAGHWLNASLALNPADSYLWLRLYSLEVTHRGFDTRVIGLLDQSFATGPLEGWIAARRNMIALAAFPTLSQGMQAKVVSEFAGLVGSDFTEAAAINLMGVGWGQRDRLLASLNEVEILSREQLAKRLWREGLAVTVPGVELGERLWR